MIVIFDIKSPIIGTPIFINEILMDIKAQINFNTTIVGDLNSQLSLIGHLDKKKKKKETTKKPQNKWNYILKGLRRYL